MILEIFTCGPIETHAVLIGCEQTLKGVVIDAPLGSFTEIAEAASHHSLTLQKLLLTHSHWDHTADASLFQKNLHLPVYVQEEDKGNLEKPGSDGLPLLIPIEGVVPDGFLKEHDKIEVGTVTLEVIHTPSHTPGCVCFWIEKEKILISGDTLFCGTIGNLSFPTARPRLVSSSLRKLTLLPPSTRVIPGHGEETTIGNELEMLKSFMGELR